MIALLSVVTLVQAAASSAALAPGTPWASYDEGYRCTIERTFGPAPGGFAMKLGYLPVDDRFTATFVRRQSTTEGDRTKIKNATSATIDLLDGGPSIAIDVQAFSVPELGIALIDGGAKADDFWARFANSSAMIVRVGPVVFSEVKFTGAAAALKAVRSCVTKQLTAWGVPAIETLKELPKISSLNRLKAIKYPEGASAGGVSGRARAHLVVSAEGKVTSCAIVESARNNQLDQETCLSARRMRFKPARDLTGRPTQSGYAFKVTWIVDGGGEVLREPFVAGFIMAARKK